MDTGQRPETNTGQPRRTAQQTAEDAAALGTLTYPISPSYVASWTPVRAICELIANALDEDANARVTWKDGVLTIADDGPGIPEEGLILGESTKDESQIGQFGEGKKIGALILARSPQIGAIRFETVGYGFIPTVRRQRLLGGQLPSRSAEGAEILHYHVHCNSRRRGTVITVECPQDLAVEAIGRFRALTEPGYRQPASGTCVLDGEPGRVWIGGVQVSSMPGFIASYDLPLSDKALQNRDRTVIDATALHKAVNGILAISEDQAVIGRFADHALGGGKLREQERFFTQVWAPRAKAAWRTWARAHLPAQSFYNASGDEEAALDLKDKGYAELTATGLTNFEQRAVMDLLGVEVARARQARHYTGNRNKTTWVANRNLTPQQRATLSQGIDLVRRAIGPYALDRVRVYSASQESPCSDGFYSPRTGDVAVHHDVLASRRDTLATLLHEAAHRVGHRGGGPRPPIPDYADRTRGFESLLGEFAAIMLERLADGGTLPELDDLPSGGSRAPVRRSGVDDPAVPVSRRDLARLLADQLAHVLATGWFTSEKDLVASTAVSMNYWRTLTRPRPAGCRAAMGSNGRAWDYERVALLAEAAGVHPPVAWLGYHLCEGPIVGRPRQRWGQQGRWTKKMREAMARACTDLEALGGPYAEQVPALQALAEGSSPATFGEQDWQTPALTLIALERQRLHLD